MANTRNSLFNISRMIDKSEKKEVSVETSFLEDLKYCIEKLNEQTTNPSPYYKPSSLHCIRNMYYQRTDTNIDSNNKRSPDSVGIAESGTDRHLRIQYYVSKMQEQGIDCEWVDVEDYIKENNLTDLEIVSKGDYETKLFNKKYNFRFMLDGLIKYQGKYYIFEIKTESGTKWINRGGVDPYHRNQAIAYSINLNIDEVMFLYENRDVCSKKVYLLKVTDEMRETLIHKLEVCEDYVNKHIVPSIPDDVEKKVCQYCQYRLTCRRDASI